MRWKKWVPYVIGIGLALGVGVLSALLSADGMRAYNETAVKPALTPPGWLFGVAWTILYVLMGTGSTRIWLANDSSERSKALNLYIAQLIVNFFWSLIFFNAKAYGFAVLWLFLLWILVVLMIRQFNKLDKKAAVLQLPYFFWLAFAAYLNIGVWILNS